jgi:hypothetical protein
VPGRAGHRGGATQALEIGADRAPSNPHRVSVTAQCRPRSGWRCDLCCHGAPGGLPARTDSTHEGTALAVPADPSNLLTERE